MGQLRGVGRIECMLLVHAQAISQHRQNGLRTCSVQGIGQPRKRGRRGELASFRPMWRGR